MPDTGAPWNIPFLDGTELVRAYPDFSEDLAEQVADGLTAAGNAGIGSNVVQTVRTDVFAASVDGSGISGDAISATITPTKANAKILVVAQISGGSTAGNAIGINLFVNGSESAYRGDAAGSRRRGVGFVKSDSGDAVTFGTVVYLDSRETTSAVTYSIRLSNFFGNQQTLYLNRSAGDDDAPAILRGASSLTLIEVAS